MTPHLLDVNVLIALVRQKHSHHEKVTRWFKATGHRQWATCGFTEAGFVRVLCNPSFTAHAITVSEALHLLSELTGLAGHRFWSIEEGLSVLARPFEERFFGHQQVTDAHLLGLALRNQGKLVTLDRGLAFLAGEEFSGNLLVL